VRGVLEVQEVDEDGHAHQPPHRHGRIRRVRVRYEAELIGLRDLLKAVQSSSSFPARLVPAGKAGGSAALSLAEKQAQHLHEARASLTLSFALTIPIVALAMVPPWVWALPGAGLEAALEAQPIPGLSVRDLLLCILSTVAQFGPGSHFIVDAYKGLKGGSYGMSLLVAMGTLAAWVFAVFSLGRSMVSGGELPGNSDFFMTSAMLLSFVLLGKYLEHAAKQRTSTALTKLMDFQAKMALLVHDGKEEQIPVELVQLGDRLKVKTLEMIQSYQRWWLMSDCFLSRLFGGPRCRRMARWLRGRGSWTRP
jgi:cation transport ATPase